MVGQWWLAPCGPLMLKRTSHHMLSASCKPNGGHQPRHRALTTRSGGSTSSQGHAHSQQRAPAPLAVVLSNSAGHGTPVSMQGQPCSPWAAQGSPPTQVLECWGFQAWGFPRGSKARPATQSHGACRKHRANGCCEPTADRRCHDTAVCTKHPRGKCVTARHGSECRTEVPCWPSTTRASASHPRRLQQPGPMALWLWFCW